MSPELHATTAQERQWRDGLFFRSLDLLCVAGFDGYFKMLNPVWEGTLGFSREELMSRPCLEFVHPDDHAITQRENANQSAGKASQSFENRYLCKDGSYKRLSWSARPVLEESCIYATAREVNGLADRNDAEAQTWISQQDALAKLGQRALHASDIAQLLDFSSLLISRALKVEYSRICELLPDRKSVMVLAGAGWREDSQRDTVPAGPHSQAGFTLASKIPVLVEDTEAECRFSIPHLLAEHSVVSSLTVAIPGHDHPFGLIGADTSKKRIFSRSDLRFTQAVADVLGIVMDRVRVEDENRKLTEELERHIAELSASNRELEAFTYSVSHDLRAPLRHIDGFSRILLEEMTDQMSDEGRRYLQMVRTGATRMGGLIEDLLKLGHVGRQALNIQMTGLNSLVEEVLSGLRPETLDRKITWHIESLPFLECDADLMKLVITNFLSNSIKFTRTREAAVIEIGSQQGQDGPIIFVRDNGVGFNMKYAGKLFGVFQRLHRQEDFEGTGVGLATVQRILHKHGGRAWAEAELDAGATFFFSLGRSEEHAAQRNEWFSDIGAEVY